MSTSILDSRRVWPVAWIAGLALFACQSQPDTQEAQPVERDIDADLAVTEQPEPEVLPEIKATPEEASFLLDSFEALANPPEVLDTSPEAVAMRTIARYFQADQDASVLTRAEVLESFAVMEQVGIADDVLTQPEFRGTYNRRRMAVPGDERRDVQDLMRGRDPWLALTAVIDADSDGALSLTEMRAFVADRL